MVLPHYVYDVMMPKAKSKIDVRACTVMELVLAPLLAEAFWLLMEVPPWTLERSALTTEHCRLIG
jgi:hypothetical protein